MPRYEFSEGTSNKFWQIDLSGKSFTTCYGKIGTDGQKTIKSWKTEAEAKKEYDKLIAEKTKKGYELVGSAGSVSDDDEDEIEEEDEEEERPAKQAAAKPVAKPAAAKPAANGGGGKSSPRRFEFSEGTSNKFWEIKLQGNAVITRYGKIGTSGQQTIKEMGTADKANKEYDKLVAEKTKKGYEETSA